MLRQIAFCALLSFAAVLPLAGHAATADWPWAIKSVQITEVPEVLPPVIQFENDCSGLPSGQEPFVDVGIGWSDIVAIGKQVWQVITDNQPVVVTNIPTVHALPRGVQCWADLDSWHAPYVKTYDVTYKNGFGMEVVKFRFRLQFTYGGGRNGKGMYIANATVMPAELNVMWGYTFNADVDVPNAVNVGTFDSPVAGMEMNLKWTVKTVLQNNQNSVHFFVQGDGKVQVDQ